MKKKSRLDMNVFCVIIQDFVITGTWLFNIARRLLGSGVIHGTTPLLGDASIPIHSPLVEPSIVRFFISLGDGLSHFVLRLGDCSPLPV